MPETNMIETRPKKIKSKPLKNKYRANYNHHASKFDTGQKLNIIGVILSCKFSGQDTTKLVAFLKCYGCHARILHGSKKQTNKQTNKKKPKKKKKNI